jgi:hypothetical protein
MEIIYRLIFYLDQEMLDRVRRQGVALGPPKYVLPEDGSRIQYPKRLVLNKVQDGE